MEEWESAHYYLDMNYAAPQKGNKGECRTFIACPIVLFAQASISFFPLFTVEQIWYSDQRSDANFVETERRVCVLV